MISKFLKIVFLTFIFSPNIIWADSDIYVERNEAIASLLQSDYVNMWWQWTKSMPKSDSPVRDMTGEKCHVNQAGPVWFLAGGYGSSLIYRKCSIPSDKYIFFPIINMVTYLGRNKELTCEQALKSSSMNNNHLVSFKVLIDDKEFVNPAFFRQSSKKCFDIAARIPGYQDSMSRYPSATDGFWMMLKPLSIGKHKIAFHAEYDNPNSAYGMMVQHIAYEINVYDKEKSQKTKK